MGLTCFIFRFLRRPLAGLSGRFRTAFLTFYPEPNARKLMVLRMTVYCMILNTRQHTLLQEEVSERWITDRMLSVHHIIMAPTVPGPHPRQHQNQYPLRYAVYLTRES
jgi:hypothetical protein